MIRGEGKEDRTVYHLERKKIQLVRQDWFFLPYPPP